MRDVVPFKLIHCFWPASGETCRRCMRPGSATAAVASSATKPEDAAVGQADAV